MVFRLVSEVQMIGTVFLVLPKHTLKMVCVYVRARVVCMNNNHSCIVAELEYLGWENWAKVRKHYLTDLQGDSRK